MRCLSVPQSLPVTVSVKAQTNGVSLLRALGVGGGGVDLILVANMSP